MSVSLLSHLSIICCAGHVEGHNVLVECEQHQHTAGVTARCCSSSRLLLAWVNSPPWQLSSNYSYKRLADTWSTETLQVICNSCCKLHMGACIWGWPALQKSSCT